MLYNQPLATRFGTDLIAQLGAPDWRSLDIAVAWVRLSGMAHMRPHLEAFVSSGRRLRVIVGVDLDNTTKEGLQALLDLNTAGKVELFVHHNESAGVFHPKLYLLTAKSHATLIVGSNNLTQAGLYQNTEAGLSVDLPTTNPVIKSARDAIAAWSDTTGGLAKVLDAALLADLVANGYVRDEAAANAAIAARTAKALSSKKKKIFANVPVTAPPAPSGGTTAKPGSPASSKPLTTTAPTGGTGSVLLMRLRKASIKGRPTQTQIPKAVASQPFFSGVKSVISSHTNQPHVISEAEARGIVNTLKLEIPEMRHFSDPVIRFESTSAGLVYEVYDSSTPKGQGIMNSLKHGLSTKPNSTFLTLADASRATWWRFI